MSRHKQILTTLATVCILFWGYFFWLPKEIEDQREQALQRYPLLQDQPKDEKMSSQVFSQNLIDYLHRQRAASPSSSDTLSSDEVVENFEQFQEDYVLKENKEEEILPPFDQSEVNLLKGDSAGLVVPDGIKNIVNFWVHVFGKWDRNTVIFHHPDNVAVVYSVLDFSELGTPDENAVEGVFTGVRGQIVEAEKKRIRQILHNITTQLRKPQIDLSSLTDDERHIAELILNEQDGLDLNGLDTDAALTTRTGWSQRFKRAVQLSGQYMPEMQRIFSQYGLPEELTCIPFVESAFNENAYSSAGAAGIWQFIAATGKRYLRIDESVDERYDPILATHAAARHLTSEYKMLGSWPLTINAYNTGPGRILDAMKVLGTRDISTIIRRYKGSGYGYDSRNYYPEVLAAIEVYNNRHRYFGDLETLPKIDYAYIRMPAAMNIKEILREAGVEMEVIQKFNLALDPAIISGERKLLKGYSLKVAPEHKENIMIAMHERMVDEREASFHITEKGETLDDIAMHYGLEKEILVRLNHLSENQKLKTGQILRLPESEKNVEVSVDENGFEDDNNYDSENAAESDSNY